MIPHIAEGINFLVVDHIKNNVNSLITIVNNERSDEVQLEEIADVFFYENAKGYRAPVIFSIIDTIFFTKESKQTNFIDAEAELRVSCLVQERNAELLTLKSYRMQSVLHRLLDQQILTSNCERIKLSLVVIRADFSPEFSDAKKESSESLFKKEVVLSVKIYYHENYN